MEFLEGIRLYQRADGHREAENFLREFFVRKDSTVFGDKTCHDKLEVAKKCAH